MRHKRIRFPIVLAQRVHYSLSLIASLSSRPDVSGIRSDRMCRHRKPIEVANQLRVAFRQLHEQFFPSFPPYPAVNRSYCASQRRFRRSERPESRSAANARPVENKDRRRWEGEKKNERTRREECEISNGSFNRLSRRNQLTRNFEDDIRPRRERKCTRANSLYGGELDPREERVTTRDDD